MSPEEAAPASARRDISPKPGPDRYWSRHGWRIKDLLDKVRQRARAGSETAQRRVAWTERVLAHDERTRKLGEEIEGLREKIPHLEQQISGINPRTEKPYSQSCRWWAKKELPTCQARLAEATTELNRLQTNPPPGYREWTKTATAAMLELRLTVGDAGAAAIEGITPAFLQCRDAWQKGLGDFSGLVDGLNQAAVDAAEKLPEGSAVREALGKLHGRMNDFAASANAFSDYLAEFSKRFKIGKPIGSPEAEAWLKRQLVGLDSGDARKAG